MKPDLAKKIVKKAHSGHEIWRFDYAFSRKKLKGKDDNDASLERVNNVVPVAIQFKTPHDIPNHIKTQLK